MSLGAHRPILIVEDSPEDFETTVRALRRAPIQNPMRRCEDGDEALEYLHRRGRYVDPSSAPRPGLILLDLNLPGTDGREVLADIKSDPGLRPIPVVVLTTSIDERDVDRCYADGANCYIKKPVDLEGFMRAMRRLKEFWFDTVISPGGE